MAERFHRDAVPDPALLRKDMPSVRWLEPFFLRSGGGGVSWEDVGLGCSGSDTMDHVILALAPAGFWKLNESSGSIAADSSGFGQDLSVDVGYVNPLWGAAAGPPGEQTANFENGVVGAPGSGTGTNTRVRRSWAALTGSFSAAIWVNRNSTTYSQVMGQGNPGRSGGRGWMLDMSTNPTAMMAAGAGGSITALNPLAAHVWVFLAMTYDAAATTYKFYVNGLLQGTHTPTSYLPVSSSSPLWIGHDGGLGSWDLVPAHFTGSYAFLVNRVLTGTELLAVYNALPV